MLDKLLPSIIVTTLYSISLPCQVIIICAITSHTAFKVNSGLLLITSLACSDCLVSFFGLFAGIQSIYSLLTSRGTLPIPWTEFIISLTMNLTYMVLTMHLVSDSAGNELPGFSINKIRVLNSVLGGVTRSLLVDQN